MVEKQDNSEIENEAETADIETMVVDAKADEATKGFEIHVRKVLLGVVALCAAIYFALNGHMTLVLGAAFASGIVRTLILRKPLFLLAGYALGLIILLATPFFTAKQQLANNLKFDHLAGFDAELRRDEDRIGEEAKIFEDLFEAGDLGVYWEKTEGSDLTTDQIWYIVAGLNPAQKHLAPEGLADKGALNVEPLALAMRASKVVTLVDMNARLRMKGPASEGNMPFVTAKCFLGKSKKVLMATAFGPIRMLDSSGYEALAPLQRVCERMASGEGIPEMREVRPRQ